METVKVILTVRQVKCITLRQRLVLTESMSSAGAMRSRRGKSLAFCDCLENMPDQPDNPPSCP